MEALEFPASKANPPYVSALATVAREAIAASLVGDSYRPRLEGGDASFGVLVTLRLPDGRVRAARGLLGGTHGCLVDEVVEVASVVAFSEGIEPLHTAELNRLSVEVSLLHTPLLVRSLDDLDPSRYGLIVHQDGRRGFSLPDTQGIDSAAEQIASACQSGGIDQHQSFQLYRFAIDRVLEPASIPPC